MDAAISTRLGASADGRALDEFSSPAGAEKSKNTVLVRSCSPSASGPLGPRPRLAAQHLRWSGVLLVLVLVVAGSGCGGSSRGEGDDSAARTGGAASTMAPGGEPALGRVLRWSASALPLGADVGPEGIAPSGGPGPAFRPASGNTGDIDVVEGPDGGRALQFPEGGVAALEAADPDTLNPGDHDIEVSAWVSIRPEELREGGSNVVAKGTFDQPQWKIQADHGVASCRFADESGRDIVWEGAEDHDVDDGDWYLLTCRKSRSEVSLTVQRLGAPPAAPETTPTRLGPIANDRPATIGAKGTGDNNDQWRGRIGEVTLKIG